MTARDVIANRHGDQEAGAIINDLTAAGYSIVHESEIQELRKEAARYRWLRDGNAYAPEEWMVTGGPVLDQFIDESIRESALPDGGANG